MTLMNILAVVVALLVGLVAGLLIGVRIGGRRVLADARTLNNNIDEDAPGEAEGVDDSDDSDISDISDDSDEADISDEADGVDLSEQLDLADQCNGYDGSCEQRIDVATDGREVVIDEELPEADRVLIEKLISYIEEQMHRPGLSVEELSEYMKMSRVHLYRKVTEATCRTPIELIRVVRLRRGRQILKENPLGVAEVGAMVGFNTPRIFSRYFREEYGVTPSEFRNYVHSIARNDS